MKCVDCDDCKFRCENSLCELSENDEYCPLANMSDFNNCVVGLDGNNVPIMDFYKIVKQFSIDVDISLEQAEEFISYNYLRILETYKTKPIILYTI